MTDIRNIYNVWYQPRKGYVLGFDTIMERLYVNTNMEITHLREVFKMLHEKLKAHAFHLTVDPVYAEKFNEIWYQTIFNVVMGFIPDNTIDGDSQTHLSVLYENIKQSHACYIKSRENMDHINGIIAQLQDLVPSDFPMNTIDLIIQYTREGEEMRETVDMVTELMEKEIDKLTVLDQFMQEIIDKEAQDVKIVIKQKIANVLRRGWSKLTGYSAAGEPDSNVVITMQLLGQTTPLKNVSKILDNGKFEWKIGYCTSVYINNMAYLDSYVRQFERVYGLMLERINFEATRIAQVRNRDYITKEIMTLYSGLKREVAKIEAKVRQLRKEMDPMMAFKTSIEIDYAPGRARFMRTRENILRMGPSTLSFAIRALVSDMINVHFNDFLLRDISKLRNI